MTAMKLFAEKGYNSTSVIDILNQADVHSGSLYHHFETKQSVLTAVLEYYRDHIEAMLIQPAWEGVKNPIDRIFALLDRYRDLLRITDFQYGCPIGSLALELHEPDPAVRTLLGANFDRWTSFVERCLAAADGKRSRRDNHALATLVLTTMEGGVMLARTHRSIASFDAAVSALRTHMLSLFPRAKRKP